MSRTAPSTHGPDLSFWEARYRAGQTGWDLGRPHPQLEHWIRTGKLTPVVSSDPGHADARLRRVLVPGCGMGREVVLLAEWGFDVLGLDYTPAAVAQASEALRQLIASPQGRQVVRAEVLETDLFSFEPAVAFDAVYEQQCLVALHPTRWPDYVRCLHRWLRPGGRLLVVLDRIHPHPAAAPVSTRAYEAPEWQPAKGRADQGPPYHCTLGDLRQLFPDSAWEWPVEHVPPQPGEGAGGLILLRR
ncbi:MAG: methyltransferase domain-containing protein [Lautropia sp.]|nr:methyltransferase domain-containing protein [Lautropia sp.]